MKNEFKISHCEQGWYASRDTGRSIDSGGPYSPILEYITLGGECDLITHYFETLCELELAIKESDKK